jgi:hypothetical protein
MEKSHMSQDIVRQAVEMAKSGNRTEARRLATQAVRSDPNNASAWVVMAQVVTDRKQAIDCLEKVLQLEPGHPWATLHLARLRGETAPPSTQAPTAIHPAASRGAGAQAAPDSEPEDLMADLRRRSISTADIDLSDLGDFTPAGAGASTAPTRASSELDPLAGTQSWQRPPTETGEFRYDQVANDLDSLKASAAAAPRKRRGVPCMLFVVVFVVAVIVAVGVGAYMMGLLPFQ